MNKTDFPNYCVSCGESLHMEVNVRYSKEENSAIIDSLTGMIWGCDHYDFKYNFIKDGEGYELATKPEEAFRELIEAYKEAADDEEK